MLNYKNMTSLNLADNKLVSIPQNLTYLDKLDKLERVFLGGNPFHCDCDMSWMMKWINNFTDVPGGRLVSDYKNMKCHSGKMIGKPIYQLDEVEMECYPYKMSIAQKVGIGIGALAGSFVMVLIIFISKRSRELKFFMFYYLKLDTVPKEDKDEDLTNMEYDAFFCFRSVLSIKLRWFQNMKDYYEFLILQEFLTSSFLCSHKDAKWVSDVFMKNKKKRSRRFNLEKEYGFRLMIHERDWIAGRTIRANIVDSLEKSRRVIFIVSRYLLWFI